MTAVAHDVPSSPAARDAAPEMDRAGAMLLAVFEALDRQGLPYCVLHGYETYPRRILSDVDLLVAREMLPGRVAEVLRGAVESLGGRVVQWFEDRAPLIVLADRAEAGRAPAMLQLHVCADYEVKDRVIFQGEEVLRSRRRREGWWIPAAEVEFAAIVANRLVKGEFKQKHLAQLAALWAESPAACAAQLERLLGVAGARMIAAGAEKHGLKTRATQAGDASQCGTGFQPVLVLAAAQALRKQLLRRTAARQPLGVIGRIMARPFARLRRWTNPQSGLHVVFLGPDGVGKSTVIDAVQSRLAPAFLHSDYQTFARGILPTKPKPGPHALPPRSFAASLLKAAWWLMCYTLGYYRRIYPTKARGGLVINHRYLVDAIVDPKRYRYAGPMRLLRWIWAVAPRPDVVIFLDAPAEVIQQRKQELPFAETARLRAGYLALAETLPNARVIDASQSLETTIDDVTETLLALRSARVTQQMRRWR